VVFVQTRLHPITRFLFLFSLSIRRHTNVRASFALISISLSFRWKMTKVTALHVFNNCSVKKNEWSKQSTSHC
jgi:hypothetical protein